MTDIQFYGLQKKTLGKFIPADETMKQILKIFIFFLLRIFGLQLRQFLLLRRR